MEKNLHQRLQDLRYTLDQKNEDIGTLYVESCSQ